MAIGRYRETPTEMDDVEREVAAAQYPEGGLVVGVGAGMLLAVALLELLLLVTPFLGGVVGFAVGRAVRDREIRRRRTARSEGDG